MSGSVEDAVSALHARVDAAVAPLEQRHRDRLKCARGCTGCCVDDITVFEVEADLIRLRHGRLLEEGVAHAQGACAFLDDQGACRIYADRPYVCRTQGLPLRWIDHELEAELRDICELNEEGPLITDLTPDDCWTLGPIETELQRLQLAHGESLARVRLRDLFEG